MKKTNVVRRGYETFRGSTPASTETEALPEEAEPPGTTADAPVGHRSDIITVVASAPEASVPPGPTGDTGQAGRCRPEPARISARSDAFRARFFPNATVQQWNDWRWQLRNRIRDATGLERVIRLSSEERGALVRRRGLPLRITPYYASLLDPDDPDQPLRRTVVPVLDELRRTPGEADDPLAEDHSSPVPGIVHRYPDRVLFLVTGACSVYCRYCTRSRMVGGRAHCFNPSHWEAALGYIAGTPAVRDVLLSGGDPLTMPGERLEWLLGRLAAIPHVEMVRIGTKVPAVLPQRVTPALTGMLRRYHPLWMSLHFTHPDELTPETALACTRLADAGIPLGSQTVLLRGVNDDVATMKRLFHGLLRMRVRPYYLYQCDPISGSAHFRTPTARGLDIIRGLRGHTSGYAVPNYVVDAPGGGGKIPLLPDYNLGHDGGDLVLRNYEDRTFRYPDPA